MPEILQKFIQGHNWSGMSLVDAKAVYPLKDNIGIVELDKPGMVLRHRHVFFITTKKWSCVISASEKIS